LSRKAVVSIKEASVVLVLFQGAGKGPEELIKFKGKNRPPKNPIPLLAPPTKVVFLIQKRKSLELGHLYQGKEITGGGKPISGEFNHR